MEYHIPKTEDLMIKNPVIGFLDNNVIHVAATLLKERWSFLPMIDRESGDFQGIISEKELMIELVNDTLYRFFHETPLNSLIKRDIHCLHPDMDLFNAEEFFRFHNLRQAPVVRDKKLLGLISRKELLAGALTCIQDKKASFIEINKLKNYEPISLVEYARKLNNRVRPMV